MWAASEGFFTGEGVVHEMNDYSADGTIADYMAGVLHVPFVLTFELYGSPGDLPSCFVQFNPSSARLDATLRRFHPMYKAGFMHILRSRVGEPPATVPVSEAERRRAEGSVWEVLVGMDSPGSDLFKLELTPKVEERVELLKEICELTPRCAGFTSTGWLKFAIHKDSVVPLPS
eukprot:CAMPEP_0113675460 /NCGR_PEP_ID=MMETSP0038_2-20120614/8029_1 /TAXON_ID=2898 /ORGANISM="Cryptomonas paramecium" /LENGTH=173 /DNA_ID=CAMNT_0000592239 /DNA_START=57 /DNA_END=574 /DNA_ORIENTATION=+ /assembly_acc=CAM_ASM_000170